MMNISYATTPHSDLIGISKALNEILNHLPKVDDHFHRIASEITANYLNTFELDLHNIFKALQETRDQIHVLLDQCHKENTSLVFWEEARNTLYMKLCSVRGYAEIIFENLTEFSQNFVYQLNLLIKTTDEILPHIEQLQPLTTTLKESDLTTTIFPSCFIGSAYEKSTILLIDHNDERRALYERRFFYSNYELIQASTGSDALKIANNRQVDLILLDMNMKDMNSYDILFALKHNSETVGIPILVISPLKELDKVSEFIRAGADDYVPSSISLILFFARISCVLLKKKYLDQEKVYQQEIAWLEGKIADLIKQ